MWKKKSLVIKTVKCSIIHEKGDGAGNPGGNGNPANPSIHLKT